MRALNNAKLRPLHHALTRLAPWAGALLVVPFVYAATGPFLWPGIIALAVGEFFQLWAAANLAKNQVLANTGPYVVMRNPMYFGRFFVGLGLLSWLSFWTYIVPIYVLVFWVYANCRALREEERLRGILGERYVDYLGSVNRWLPLRRLPGARATAWTWENVRANRQLHVTAGVLLVLALVVLRRQFAL